MFCSKCGGTVDSDAKFCGNCGNAITFESQAVNATPATNSSQSSNNQFGAKLINIVKKALISILIFFGLAGIYFSLTNSTQTAQVNAPSIPANNTPDSTTETEPVEKDAVNLQKEYEERVENSGKQADLANIGEVIETTAEGQVFYKAKGKVCNKVNGFTSDYVERTAKEKGISYSSISFIRLENKTGSGDDCDWVVLNTPNGPISCVYGSIVKNTKNQFLISAYRPGLELPVTGCFN